MTRNVLAAHMPPASLGAGALVMVCGPPGESVCADVQVCRCFSVHVFMHTCVLVYMWSFVQVYKCAVVHRQVSQAVR